MRPAIRLRVAHLRGAPLGTKRPYVRYIYTYIYTDSEIIVLTRWGSLRLAPTIVYRIVLQLQNAVLEMAEADEDLPGVTSAASVPVCFYNNYLI